MHPTEAIPSIEEVVESARQRYLDLFAQHLASAEGKNFYTADLVLFGLLNRNLGLLDAMPSLFASENIHALAPLMRVQLDGLLRLHAFRLVESMDDLARHMIAGHSPRKFKDREGEKLTDARLVATLKDNFPWLEQMYETLSGWIHLSESHIFAAVSEGDSERSIVVGIGNKEARIDPALFESARAAIDLIHRTTAGLMHGYLRRSDA